MPGRVLSQGGLPSFLAEDDGGPTVMLNLLSFVDQGEPGYRRYLEQARPIIERIGGWIVYAGTLTTSLIEVEGDDWDAMVLICWPERTMLATLARDPAYRVLNDEGRLRSIRVTSLRASTPWAEVWQPVSP